MKTANLSHGVPTRDKDERSSISNVWVARASQITERSCSQEQHMNFRAAKVSSSSQLYGNDPRNSGSSLHIAGKPVCTLCLNAVCSLQLLDQSDVLGLCLFRGDLLVDDLLPRIVLVLSLQHTQGVSPSVQLVGDRREQWVARQSWEARKD